MLMSPGLHGEMPGAVKQERVVAGSDRGSPALHWVRAALWARVEEIPLLPFHCQDGGGGDEREVDLEQRPRSHYAVSGDMLQEIKRHCEQHWQRSQYVGHALYYKQCPTAISQSAL